MKSKKRSLRPQITCFLPQIEVKSKKEVFTFSDDLFILLKLPAGRIKWSRGPDPVAKARKEF